MGRVKLKVKEIYSTKKIQARKIKEKRHQKRIEIEALANKLTAGDEPNNNTEYKSKYPKDYDQISLGSDKSDYNPFVGERNYVDAVVP